MDYATRARTPASRVIVRLDNTVRHAIDSLLVIAIFNRYLRAKPQKACIIQSIEASEASEKSRVMPGYCLACSEASAKGKVYQKRKRKNRAKV